MPYAVFPLRVGNLVYDLSSTLYFAPCMIDLMDFVAKSFMHRSPPSSITIICIWLPIVALQTLITTLCLDRV